MPADVVRRDKAIGKGALWEGGSTRGDSNLPAAVAFVEESDEEGVEGEGVAVARVVLSTTGWQPWRTAAWDARWR
jgi:hypothetical protein